jgi:hypothetical protein
MEMKSLIERLTSLENQPLNEGAKPDFLDMDKDGNKKEPMKKAVADKKKTGSDKVKKESLGRIAEALMKDMGYELDEEEYDPLSANKMDYDKQMANGQKNWSKMKNFFGQGTPADSDLNQPGTKPQQGNSLSQSPNQEAEINAPAPAPTPAPAPAPYTPGPTQIASQGNANDDATGVDAAYDRAASDAVRAATDAAEAGANKPKPPAPAPAPAATPNEYEIAQAQGMDPNDPNGKMGVIPPPKPRPPVSTQKPDPKVLELQKQLIAKGAKIKADGIMGKNTRDAMKQFGMGGPVATQPTGSASLAPAGTTNAATAIPTGGLENPANQAKKSTSGANPVTTQPKTAGGPPPTADKSQPYWVDGNKYKWVSGRGGVGGWALDQKKGEYSLWGGNEANKRSGYTDPSNAYTGPDKEPVQTQPVREDSELAAMLRIAGLR